MSNRLPPVPSHFTGELASYLRAVVQRLNNESFVSQTGQTNTFAIVQPDAGGTVLFSADTVQLSGRSQLVLSAITITQTATSYWSVYGNTAHLSATSDVRITANAVLLGSTITSTSTLGFPQMPSSQATPTGAPPQLAGANGGYVPFCYDRGNHKFWVYDTQANAWRSVPLA